MSNHGFDVIFVGGGLAGTLAACRLRQARPHLRILLLEQGNTLGGNHTWSFHETDIAPEARAWLAPFVARTWNRQQVRFPKYTRMLASGYNTIFSGSLHEAALALLDGSVRFAAPVRDVKPHQVVLGGGETLSAGCIVDARGPGRLEGVALAYQKFLGLEVRLAAPHGQPCPIIMDATVEQSGGYRFVYTLPYAADRILIEDTYYSATPDLDAARLRKLCAAYAERRGWTIADILREEQGVLPVVIGGSAEALLAQNAPGVPAIGVRGGFFHHTTSYSLPFAVRCAGAIAAMEPLTSEALDPLMKKWAREHWQQQSFFRLLNRLLFWAAKPGESYRVLERFYQLGEPLIERFYGSSLSRADKARILLGRPPVPIGNALRVIMTEGTANPIPQAPVR